MMITQSEISCGIEELFGIGPDPDNIDYFYAMRDFHGAMLIASVPVQWKRSIKFLKNKGFKRVFKQVKNPNSGNKIVLMGRTFSKKERECFINERGFCYECDDPILDKKGNINKRRSVCNICKKYRNDLY